MKLTKEQKAELEDKLTYLGGTVELLCDGYRVALQVQRWKGLSMRVMTFVDGTFKGVWFRADKPCPEQKFLRKSEKNFWSPSEKARAEKIFGKRAVAKDPLYSLKVTMFHPDWASGKAAISHLVRVCESVEIAPEVQP
ncbi:hypothetical protein [Propionivibrio dicarboxylicus]|uniref:Uncharacterized protein n=1 Tax=Propionivibrio dicarboxylicus TaxID=83767 RepID=A0A1G8LA97_9RHOO|nr:hypothetical protein [Propionivibrio dicarboxylicus]SDI52591.1 hypothetical protein SAMN05660652_03585 [Propionivibrio dicarboxylicus]